MRRYALEMRENVAAEFRKQLWEALQLVVLEQSRLIYHVMLIIVNDIVESINVSVFFCVATLHRTFAVAAFHPMGPG